MEFGSNHVYAGVPPDVYYSSVPKEKTNQQKNDDNHCDPIYESIEDVTKKKSNQPLPDSSSRSDTVKMQGIENVYDSVAEENNSKNETVLNANKTAAPMRPDKPAIYQSVEEKENNSTAQKGQKVLNEQVKNPNEFSQNNKITVQSTSEVPVPSALPRKPRAKTVPDIPPPIPSRNVDPSCAPAELLELKQAKASSVPDLLMDVNKPLVAVPLLKPPPSIPKQKSVLPNAPFDPFSIPHQTDPSAQVKEILRSTVLKTTPNQHDVPSTTVETAETNAKEIVDLSCLFVSNNSETSVPTANDASCPDLQNDCSFGETNPFSKNYKPPQLEITNADHLELSEKSASSMEDSIATKNSASVETTNGHFNPNIIPSCYPSLPGKEDAVVDEKENDLKPSAPPLTATLMRKDAEFLQQRLRNLNVGQSGDSLPDDANIAPEVGVTSLIRPSAPHLSKSMIRRDRDLAKRPVKRTNSTKSIYASADTNIVCVKLGIIGDTKASFFQQAIPSHCVACGAISINTEQEWKCIFCESQNTSHVQSVPPDNASDVIYVLQPPLCPSMAESLVIFCVDTSGSMCVSSEVTSGTGSLFVSRLKSLQQAITDQLNVIEATKPDCRVALVTFNSEVQVLGDGSPEQAITLSEFQLLDFDYLCHVGWHSSLPSSIRSSRVQLTKAVLGLKESGGTALGPALLLSTAIASKLPGSQVVVCTDGRANVGVGSLETEEDYASCHHFYNQATALAASKGVVVSIMSIAGSDCRLVQLGKVADKTSGKVSIAETSELSQAFESIILGDVLATNVSIDLVTQRNLYFYNDEGISGSSLSQFIGNATSDSEVTFRYGMRTNNESALPHPKEAHFQLKIMYRTRDGAVNMRVLTQRRAVTEDREVAESEMNPAVIGTYASQSAARLALQGDLDSARYVTDAHKNLIDRGMSLRSTSGQRQAHPQEESIYECVLKRMNDIGQDLSQIDTSSTPLNDDQSQNATCTEPERIPEDVYDDDEICDMQQPPALPPRTLVNQSRSKPPLKHSSSSFESMLSKLPSIAKGPKTKAKRTKRHKQKTAMQYKDQSAQKMFKMSKVNTSSFRFS